MNIVAVCTGNTCRSPIIEGLLKGMYPKFNVKSFGIYANKEKVSKNAVLALKQEGIDISDKISAPLDLNALLNADLVITVSEGHKEYLKSLGAQKVINIDCPDPYNQDLDFYIKTKDYIKQKLKEISF